MSDVSFAELFPEIPVSRREEARANLDAYLALAMRIHDRLEAEAVASAIAALTDRAEDPTMDTERSRTNQSHHIG